MVSSMRRLVPIGAGSDGWSTVTLLLGCLLVGPFAALLYTMTGDSGGLWSHLMTTVFPRYAVNTLVLMLGVGLLSLGFGLSTAWVLTRYRFPGSYWLEWALLLPATVPGYIIAYTYTDLLEFAGPVQTFLRDLFGWQTVRDYWFPRDPVDGRGHASDGRGLVSVRVSDGAYRISGGPGLVLRGRAQPQPELVSLCGTAPRPARDHCRSGPRPDGDDLRFRHR